MRAIALLLLVALTMSTASANDASLEQFFDDYIASYNDYFEAGENADINAVTAHFYEPTMQIPQRGSPRAAATRADLNGGFSGFLKVLQDMGTVRLEWEHKQLVQLSPKNAIASNIARAMNADGEVVDRRSTVYSVYRTDTGWEIAVIQSHAVAAAPILSPAS